MLGNNKKSIGFNNSLYNNKGGLSAAALLWKANIIANGGTIPDATLQIFDTNFFIPATANGNILNQLDRLNIYCGLDGYQIAARTNIISSSFFVTPVSSPTFDNNGYKSSGTSYLNLNYNPFTQGVKYNLNSASIFTIIKEPTYLTKNPIGAVEDGSIIRGQLQLTATSLNAFVNSTGATTNTNISSIGNVFFGGVRTNSTNINSIINNNIISSVNANTGIVNLNIFELVLNFRGSTFGTFDTNYHLCSGHGSANLDISALRTILNNLFTALGV